jgi:hypothetical protein
MKAALRRRLSLAVSSVLATGIAMSTRAIRFWFLALTLFAGVSCASAGSSSATTTGTSDVEVPARMLQTTTIFRMPGRFSGTVEVPIGVNGRADVLRMKVMGRMTEEVRRAFIEFFEQSSFAPATRNGQPVPGTYKMKMALR